MREIYVSTDVEADGPIPGPHSMLSFGSAAFTADGKLGLPYRESTKRNMPKRWFPASPHTHVALDDAIEQGQLFCNILAERSRRTAD